MKRVLPIHILIFFLSFLALCAAIAWNGSHLNDWLLSLRNLLLIGVSSFAVRFTIRTLIEPTFNARHEHRIITALILFLLFDSLLPWWTFVLLGAATEAVQFFFRTQIGPLFNPAALGALILSFFGYLPSWWGVNPAPRIPLLGIDVSIITWITAFGALYVIHRYKKLPVAVSAFLAAALSYLFFFQQSPAYLLLEGTLLFFILIMVCEPKTSPVNRTEQIIYGTLVGFLVPAGLYFHFIEASIIALLIGNIYSGRRFLFSLFTSLKKASQIGTPA